MKSWLSLFAGVLLVGFAAGCAGTSSQQAKTYPLQTCIVTDEELGGHGEPYVFVHNGQEIKMCCKDCLAEFQSDPAKYMAKIQKGN